MRNVLEGLNEKFLQARKALDRGEFVLLYDGADREGEVDMVTLAENIKPETLHILRRDAGGLICVALHPSIAEIFGLPFLHSIFEESSEKYPFLAEMVYKQTAYGSRPAFSIPVNHKNTFTGIPDVDRAKTIKRLGELGREACFKGNDPSLIKKKFVEEFLTPGHVYLLRAADGLLSERRGHTELCVYLAELLGFTPVVVICEMLDGDTGRALSVEKAKNYAKDNGYPFLRGQDLISTYLKQLNPLKLLEKCSCSSVP
ncbi:MAG: 3,4-dihydroxy-2-butanone-4-phosphate synthase [Candidatus Hodarchaeota archaeon]